MRHLLFFVFFLIYFIPVNQGITSTVIFYGKILDFVYVMAASYFTIYFLVPKYLLKGRIAAFITGISLTALIIFILITTVEYLLYFHFEPNLDTIYPIVPSKLLIRFLYFSLTFMVLISIPIFIKILGYWLKNLEQLNQLQQVNFENELAILKNQLSPHFLFNTLNNINILTESNPGLASKLILNLSELLRYQIYSGTGDRVSLKSDIAFIKNFLFVESLRKDNFKYNIEITGEQKDVFLPPLLFIPFIENSVKHIDQENPFVTVHFHLEKNILLFSCRNSIGITSDVVTEHNGLGLVNIKKRLQLLFPEKNQLIIENQNTEFFVSLTITL
ncbi:sensor histidine kinase [Flavobacterium cerinum]|uniref:Histidine kinase n=1 Tax=Flavobacterium cerinum TaxID=2502784 RepID=A0ABY5IM58_9FLAO|nr:histidine kinase [Flavobacterium cerinum]UUC43921.1 histidine kinase [Flavobacterium cerinum]